MAHTPIFVGLTGRAHCTGVGKTGSSGKGTKMTKTGAKLGRRQKAILLEAARRWLRSADRGRKQALTSEWTGLGSATTYASVLSAGFMIQVEPHPGTTTWWRLTDKGAAIVQHWIDNGLCSEHFQTDDWIEAYSLVNRADS